MYVCMNVCVNVRNRFLRLIISSPMLVRVMDDKKCCLRSNTLLRLKMLLKWWEKKKKMMMMMIIGRSRCKVGDDDDDDRMYIHVFGLRLSPSMCSSFSLPRLLLLLRLFFVFQKPTCAQAHHMCDGRARILSSSSSSSPSSSSSSSSSLPDMLYNHSNITFRCMCTAKEDEHGERKT